MRPMESAVALVTGGASGIGRATARALASHGARVTIADLPSSPGAAAAEEVGGTFLALDVRDSSAWRTAVEGIEAREGHLDLVHLNAGVATGRHSIVAIGDERYRDVLAVNVDGVFYGLRAALPALRRAGGGAAVVTASLGGLAPMPVDPVYAMTKHAVIGLVRSVAPTVAPHGIIVNAVCPSFTDTRLVDSHRAVLAGLPLLTPDQVAAAVLVAAAAPTGGQAYVVVPGQPPQLYPFADVPGPEPVSPSPPPPPAPR